MSPKPVRNTGPQNYGSSLFSDIQAVVLLEDALEHEAWVGHVLDEEKISQRSATTLPNQMEYNGEMCTPMR